MKLFKFSIFIFILFTAYYAFALSTFGENSQENEAIKLTANSVQPNVAQENKENIYQDREDLSINTKTGKYSLDDCISINHTDGKELEFCISNIEGASNGFYDYNKSLIVVENLDITTIVHELVHASTVYNSIYIGDDITKVTDAKFQERIAYDTEYLLSQILKVKNIENIK